MKCLFNLTSKGQLYVFVCIRMYLYVYNAHMYVSVCICMYLYASILCQWLRKNHKALMHIHTHTCKYIYTHEAEGILDNLQPRHLLLEHHEGVAEGISVPTHGRPAGCKQECMYLHVSACICMYSLCIILYVWISYCIGMYQLINGDGDWGTIPSNGLGHHFLKHVQ